MSISTKAKSRRVAAAKADLTKLPAPVTTADRVVLEIRKFIAAGIFFNAQAAEKAGLGLTDMQLLHMLQLYGPSTPSRLAAMDAPEQRRHHGCAGPAGEGGLPPPRGQSCRPAQPADHAHTHAFTQNCRHV